MHSGTPEPSKPTDPTVFSKERFRVFAFIVFFKRFLLRHFYLTVRTNYIIIALLQLAIVEKLYIKQTENTRSPVASEPQPLKMWQCWIVWFRQKSCLFLSWSRAETIHTELEDGLGRKAWNLDRILKPCILVFVQSDTYVNLQSIWDKTSFPYCTLE